jgi:hypothetical protein
MVHPVVASISLFAILPLQVPAEPSSEPAPPQTTTSSPPDTPGVRPESKPSILEAQPMAHKVAKRKPARAWWSHAGIVVGLSTAAVAGLVTVAGVATQALALYFWIDQGSTNRPRAEQEFASRRARWTQWTALGLMLGGVATVYGGFVLATYAFGLGNPDPTKASDL